ncbi:GNAT family N-acetyltransferase [Actinoplanes xinjiangensis]|uniref:GNAT family N-acetyltransferase n=1 Tax=Actinoplanes xinjiangensis TaxID=512350 RepID=UPI0034280B02
MLIEIRPALDPELAALITAQQRESAESGVLAGRRTFQPDEDVAYLVGVVNGRAVACAAWQAVGPAAAELLRIYVRPAFRGRGLARQMIVAIEEEALAAGRPLLRLELEAGMSAAIALYQSSGYRQATPDAPDRVRFEKRLPALVQ